MKKIILTLFVALAAQAIDAQPSRYRGDRPYQYKGQSSYTNDYRGAKSSRSLYFGLRAGLSVSSYFGDFDIYDYDYDYGYSSSSSTNSIAGFHVGYLVGIPIAKDLFIETGVYFGNKGYSAKGYDISSYYEDEDCRYKESMRTYNFDLPINLTYRANISDGLFFDIKGGPYLTYAAFGTYTSKEWSPSGYNKFSLDLDEYEDEFDNFNRFGVGLNFGCGFGINNFYVGMNYQIGLTNAISSDWSSTTYNESNFTLSLGCNF